MPWWGWLILGIGLLGVEMFVVDAQFYLVFIGVAAALVGLLGLTGIALPQWAQWLGEVLPLTHFLRIVRGIMLKGNGLAELWPQIWPIVAFMLVVIAIGLRFYKRTLD